MLEHDLGIRKPQRPGGPHIFEIPCPEKLGAHQAHEPRPRKQHQHEQQDPECRRDEGGEDDEQIERRQRRPDVDEALEQQIGPAAEIALHRARHHADDRRQHREDEPEGHRDAEAIDQPRDDIAALIVGAQPVQIAEAAIDVINALFIFGAQQPRGRGGTPGAMARASAIQHWRCCRNSGSAARSSSHWPRSLPG